MLHWAILVVGAPLGYTGSVAVTHFTISMFGNEERGSNDGVSGERSEGGEGRGGRGGRGERGERRAGEEER